MYAADATQAQALMQQLQQKYAQNLPAQQSAAPRHQGFMARLAQMRGPSVQNPQLPFSGQRASQPSLATAFANFMQQRGAQPQQGAAMAQAPNMGGMGLGSLMAQPFSQRQMELMGGTGFGAQMSQMPPLGGMPLGVMPPGGMQAFSQLQSQLSPQGNLSGGPLPSPMNQTQAMQGAAMGAPQTPLGVMPPGYMQTMASIPSGQRMPQTAPAQPATSMPGGTNPVNF